jgi:4-hydroxybenzoyl-CoA thioesterase
MTEHTSIRRIRVEFGHCAPLQIVYYPNYATWCDQSTHHMFESVGLPLRDLQSRLYLQIPLVDLSLKFVSPAGWGDDIEIASRISRWGGKSFDVSHRLTIGGTGVEVLLARETRVCVEVDPTQPKKISGRTIPSEVKNAFHAAGLVSAQSQV